MIGTQVRKSQRYDPFAKFEITGNSDHPVANFTVNARMVDTGIRGSGGWVRYDDVLSLMVKEQLKGDAK